MRKTLTALLMSAVTIIACTKIEEELPAAPNLTEPNATVRVQMSIAPESLDPTSRAVAESSIDDVNIFLYGADDYHLYEDGTHVDFELLPGDYMLYVVANIGADMGAQSQEDIDSFKATNQTIDQNGKIVMSTKINVSIPSTNTVYTLPTVTLFRSAAKVTFNISIDESVAQDIELQSVALHSEATWCRLFDVKGEPAASREEYCDRKAVEIDNPNYYSETVYLIENLQGEVATITDQRDKCPENAPANATYLKIYAQAKDKILEYIVYLGENNTSDFNIRRNTQHTMNIVIMGEDKIDNRTTVYNGLYYGTANCIINTGKSVTFDITPYRTSKALSYRYTGVKAGDDYNAVRAMVLWQDKQGLARTATISDNKLTLTTSGEEGNIVVGIFNTDNQIIWSFHIWCTDYPRQFTLAENAYGNIYTAMDRNLGATSPAVGSQESFGLLYQWGRKDPFIGAIGAEPEQSDTNGKIYSASSMEMSFKNLCQPTPEGSTIQSVIARPMFLYYQSYGHANWYDAGDEHDPHLWGNALTTDGNPPKSVYDPSPAGFKVPPYDFMLIFNKHGKLSSSTSSDSKVENYFTFSSFYKGWRFFYDGAGQSTQNLIHLPASGMRGNTSSLKGGLSIVGTTGMYWTSTNKSQTTNYNFRLSATSINASASHNASVALSVRCVRE